MLSPDGGQFNDPFAKSAQQQLQDLWYLLRVRRLITEENISADSTDADEATKIAGRLKLNGVDIDWLLGQRDVIHIHCEQHSRAIAGPVAKKVKGKRIRLNGYVMPLNEISGRVD